MKSSHRNGFLLFGVLAIALMLYTFPEGAQLLFYNRTRMLLFLPCVVATWGVVYLCNARAFQLLVNSSDHDQHLPFFRAYKLTISGFAFAYTTPFGSGGVPYRVMELSRFIGTPRAVSAVALYSMMHIFSHFFLWTTALLLFVLGYASRLTPLLWLFAALYLLIFVGAILFFHHSYKYGIIARLFRLLFHLPFLRRHAQRFYEQHAEAFAAIDANIRFLYEHPRQLWGALAYEYLSRLVNSFEFYFILLAFGLTQATWADALIIVGFASLVGNLLFFLPMQLGAREGGLAIIVPLLFGTTAAIGIYVSIFTRVREIFWIVLGVLLVKIGNQRLMHDRVED